MRRRGGIWQARPKAGDKLGKWRSTRCTDKKAAEAVLAEWERELADPTYAAAKGITLAHAVDRLNRDMASLVRVGKRSQATADYYIEKTGVLLNVLGQDAVLADVAKAGVVDRYVEVRREEEVAECTIGKELGVLRVVLKTARRAGWWVGDIDAIMPAGVSAASKPRENYVADLRQLGKILRCVGPDIAAQIAFSVATGAEAQAIRRAQPTDIAERYVAVHGKKRPTRERVVPVVASWQETLLRYARSHLSEFGFRHGQGLPKALRLACQRLGIPHLSPNDLRRTFNVWMDEAGVPVALRAQAMGHASTRLLDKFTYGKLSPDMLRARMAEVLDGRPDRRATNGVDLGGARRRMGDEDGQGTDRGQEVQDGPRSDEVAGARGTAFDHLCGDGEPTPHHQDRAAGARAVLPAVTALVQVRSVVCQSGVMQKAANVFVDVRDHVAVNDDSPLKMAPRAGIEPATYGLTVRAPNWIIPVDPPCSWRTEF